MKYFTVGPGQLHPLVKDFTIEAHEKGVCSISHRSKEFERIFEKTITNLRNILGIPYTHHIFFVGSATEAMERIVQNCSRKRTHHFVNGSFSNRFYKTALEQGRYATVTESPTGQGFSDYIVPEGAEIVCFTHTETSTGVKISEQRLHNVKLNNPDLLVAVDIVSSAPCIDLEFKLVDLAFFSVQKGFGLPAGLGVIIASPAALQKSSAVGFHSFDSMHKKALKYQTPETPNVLAIYLLGRVCENLNIQKVKENSDIKAKIMYDWLDIKGLAAVNRNDRANSIIVAEAAAEAVIPHLMSRGFMVSSGYGLNKRNHIRIANYPAHTIEDMQELIIALSSGPL